MYSIFADADGVPVALVAGNVPPGQGQQLLGTMDVPEPIAQRLYARLRQEFGFSEPDHREDTIRQYRQWEQATNSHVAAVLTFFGGTHGMGVEEVMSHYNFFLANSIPPVPAAVLACLEILQTKEACEVLEMPPAEDSQPTPPALSALSSCA